MDLVKMRETVKASLEKHAGKCLDNDAEREELAHMIAYELFPQLAPLDVFAEMVCVLATQKGWWDGQQRNHDDPGPRFLDPEEVKKVVAEKLNLIHDEVSEASAEARQDRFDVYWIIDGERRTLSYYRDLINKAWEEDEDSRFKLYAEMRRIGMPISTGLLLESKESFLDFFLRRLVKTDKPEGFGIEIMDGIIRSLDLLWALGENPEALFWLKHEYNLTRSYRHGNKRY